MARNQSVYSDPVWATLIVYPRAMEPDWQRAICAKEMVHIFDRQIIKTVNPEMIEGLAEKVVGPLDIDAESPDGIMATADKLAEFQGINLLFPLAARKLARDRLAAKEMTMKQISDWAAIPERFVKIVLDPKWELSSAILVKMFSA